LDLYSGAGTFTLPLAARYSSVSAVEAEGSSLRDLRRNLADNGLAAAVVGGDVARELAALPAAQAAVVDPPRSGLTPAAQQAIASARPPVLVYVSCNPATMARDLRYLSEQANYHLRQVQPIDQFPQTYHVESVALLTS
jgi:23S rRNA (uracil1939-C5)-methyltransferase